MKAQKKQNHKHTYWQTHNSVHWQNELIFHLFHKGLLSTYYMPGTALDPGNTVLLILSRRKEANKIQAFQLLSHDLSIPTVRRMHQAIYCSRCNTQGS